MYAVIGYGIETFYRDPNTYVTGTAEENNNDIGVKARISEYKAGIEKKSDRNWEAECDRHRL